MAIIKSSTSIEQSCKLADILPLESADMRYEYSPIERDDIQEPIIGFSISSMNYYKDSDLIRYLPCWSLAALRNLLPPAIKINKNTYLFESHNTFDKSWVYRYYNENGVSHLYCKNTNEVDACVDMIIKLHEENLL